MPKLALVNTDVHDMAATAQRYAESAKSVETRKIERRTHDWHSFGAGGWL